MNRKQEPETIGRVPLTGTRDDILQTAQTIINGSRRDDYGDAFDSFSRIAALWSALLSHPVTPSDVARCMIALKLSRLQETSLHTDSWVDIAGYAALGSEVAREE